MNVTDALKSAENSLRTLVGYKLSALNGSDWYISCGVTAERIESWKAKQSEDIKRFGYADERLIYYSDFYDLKTILSKNWEKCFQGVFGKKIKFEILFSILEGFRNPDAHRREFLPYQENLILGISGLIRTEITKYFSKLETGDSYFPRLESVQDNLGNAWTPGSLVNWIFKTNTVLRPGDTLEFSISAFDPLGEKINYSIAKGSGSYNWLEGGKGAITVEMKDIGTSFFINIAIISNRQFHASIHHDDHVQFIYSVLPPKINR